jgi:hypothetical protein
MLFTEFLQSDQADNLIKELIDILYSDWEVEFEYSNYGHYFILGCPDIGYRLEVFRDGAIELYGSNAGVHAYNLIKFFDEKNIEFESK